MNNNWCNKIIYIIYLSLYLFSSCIVAEIDAEVISNANNLINTKKYRKAIKLLENINKKTPNESIVFAKLAAAKISLAGFDSNGKVVKHGYSYQALEHLSYAIKLAPRNLKYKVAYAKLLHDLDKHEKAYIVFSELFSYKHFRQDKDFRYLIINYALTLQKINQVDKSLLEYSKSLEVTDYDERIFYSYIGGLSYAGKLHKMLSEYKKYETNKSFSPNIKYKLCMELLANKKFRQSRDCYNELLKNSKQIVHVTKRARGDLKYIERKLH